MHARHWQVILNEFFVARQLNVTQLMEVTKLAMKVQAVPLSDEGLIMLTFLQETNPEAYSKSEYMKRHFFSVGIEAVLVNLTGLHRCRSWMMPSVKDLLLLP